MKKIFKTLLISGAALVLSTQAAHASKNAMFNVDTIVYSEFNTDEPRMFDLDINEQMYGIGLSYLGKPRGSRNHWFGMGADFYDDQFKNPAYQLNGLYKYRLEFKSIIDAIEFNLDVGLINRLYHKEYQLSNNVVFHDFERETRFHVTPSIGIAFTPNFVVEASYLPEDWGENFTDGYEMIMIKAGLRF